MICCYFVTGNCIVAQINLLVNKHILYLLRLFCKMRLGVDEISIKGVRKERGLSQRGFANEIGVTQACVSQWENGQNYPKYKMLKKMTEVLECTVDELMKEDE